MQPLRDQVAKLESDFLQRKSGVASLPTVPVAGNEINYEIERRFEARLAAMKDQQESSFQQLLDMLKSLDERLPDARQMQKLLEEEKSELTATMQSVMDLGERMENIESHVQVSQKRVSLEAHEGALNELRQKISTCQAHVDATTDHMLQRSEDERTYQRAQVSALRNEFQVGLEALHGRNNSIQSLIKEQSQKAQDEISLLDHRICSAEDRLCLVEETTSKSAQTPGQVSSIADRLRKLEENQVGGQADSKMANLESIQIADEKVGFFLRCGLRLLQGGAIICSIESGTA
jgi:hypothetical protein